MSATIAALLLLAPSASAAQDVSSAEFAELVEDANQDSGSAAELREVTSIDGFQVDMGQLIDSDASEQKTQLASLERLTDDGGASAESTEDLRSEAHDIISEPPFSAEIADGGGWLDQVVDFFGRILSGDGMTGLALLIVALAAIAIAVPALLRITRNRSKTWDSPDSSQPEPRPDYAKAATEAEAQGDFEDAIRLLFLDGAEYLEDIKLVRSAATTSTATVRRLSTETEFLDRFDEVTYGGATADPGDVTQARSAWGRLKTRRFGK